MQHCHTYMHTQAHPGIAATAFENIFYLCMENATAITAVAARLASIKTDVHQLTECFKSSILEVFLRREQGRVTEAAGKAEGKGNGKDESDDDACGGKGGGKGDGGGKDRMRRSRSRGRSSSRGRSTVSGPYDW